MTLPNEIEQFRTYRATVRLRHDWPLKPESAGIEEYRGIFLAQFQLEDSDTNLYNGEWAMMTLNSEFPLNWIASGDLVDIEEIPNESPVKQAVNIR